MDPPGITVKFSDVSRNPGESLRTVGKNDDIHVLVFGVDGHIDVALPRRFLPSNA